MFKAVFVTVGTTEFDGLISTLDSSSFFDLLVKHGCESLVIQLGRGNFTPILLENYCREQNISYECFKFKPSLTENIFNSSLIISHAG